MSLGSLHMLHRDRHDYSSPKPKAALARRMAGQSALIIGATGAVGKHLLKELLASPDVARVGEYGRRVTPADTLEYGKDKLEQKMIDFEKLEEIGLKDGKWDTVYITLGTTKANAGSAAAFEKIDREYVVNAARAAKTDDPSHHQRIVYVSTLGANSSSSFLYPRSKGLTEEHLAALGYKDTIIFRPAMLKNAERAEPQIAEKIAGAVTGFLSHFSSSLEIPVSTLARSMFIAGKLGSSALPPHAQASTAGKSGTRYTVITNSGSIAMAEAEH